MDLLSAGWRRTGALAFGAAVPSVLLGSILVIGHASASTRGSDDVLPPTPTLSTSAIVVTQQTGPPIVSDFQTDSTSGYVNGLPSNDLFDCQPVLQTPKPGAKAVLVRPAKCKSRPTGK
ncbi:MAG: hypothetical protein QOC60_711 [Frankiaceae bacterium]|nr:hypothetical protein [Frankiaceae bacterium]MDQ1714766.1 hypothetical protein [Frankiaceae bacterium]